VQVSFQSLDYADRLGHLTALAERALAFYELADASLTFATYTNNAVFRVDANGQRYVLRVHRPGYKPAAWIRSELAWLSEIAQTSTLRVPVPVGDPYVGHLQGYDGDALCTLLRWVDGDPLDAEGFTLDDARAVGKLAGDLHNVSARFAAPLAFERPRLDWDGLFAPGGVYDPGEGMALFSNEHLAVIADVAERVRETMTALGDGSQAFGLIHADLIAKNILKDADGGFGLVDFDECAWGWYLYDLTPLIWLMRGTDRMHAVRDALLAGYAEKRSLPDGTVDHVDVFVAARHVASVRWVAGNADHPAIRGKAEAIIAERVETMRQFLVRGHI
jgi:Ser/Thr protein kinase RdoA (MazF antagonist)